MLKTLFKYYCIVALLWTVPAAAQDTEDFAGDTACTVVDTIVQDDAVVQRTLSDEDWQALVNDTAFSYKNEYETEAGPQPDEEGGWEKALNRFFGFFASGTGTFIFWLIVFSVLAFIVVRIFKGDIHRLFSRRENDTAQESSGGPLTKEDLLSADWQSALRSAVAEQDFRSATRFAFVHILQLLHQKELIAYRIDRTNYEYYRSLKHEELKPVLKNLLQRYEYAWFGHMPVDGQQWQQTADLYHHLKSKL